MACDLSNRIGNIVNALEQRSSDCGFGLSLPSNLDTLCGDGVRLDKALYDIAYDIFYDSSNKIVSGLTDDPGEPLECMEDDYLTDMATWIYSWQCENDTCVLTWDTAEEWSRPLQSGPEATGKRKYFENGRYFPPGEYKIRYRDYGFFDFSDDGWTGHGSRDINTPRYVGLAYNPGQGLSSGTGNGVLASPITTDCDGAVSRFINNNGVLTYNKTITDGNGMIHPVHPVAVSNGTGFLSDFSESIKPYNPPGSGGYRFNLTAISSGTHTRESAIDDLRIIWNFKPSGKVFTFLLDKPSKIGIEYWSDETVSAWESSSRTLIRMTPSSEEGGPSWSLSPCQEDCYPEQPEVTCPILVSGLDKVSFIAYGDCASRYEIYRHQLTSGNENVCSTSDQYDCGEFEFSAAEKVATVDHVTDGNASRTYTVSLAPIASGTWCYMVRVVYECAATNELKTADSAHVCCSVDCTSSLTPESEIQVPTVDKSYGIESIVSKGIQRNGSISVAHKLRVKNVAYLTVFRQEQSGYPNSEAITKFEKVHEQAVEFSPSWTEVDFSLTASLLQVSSNRVGPNFYNWYVVAYDECGQVVESESATYSTYPVYNYVDPPVTPASNTKVATYQSPKRARGEGQVFVNVNALISVMASTQATSWTVEIGDREVAAGSYVSGDTASVNATRLAIKSITYGSTFFIYAWHEKE